MVSIYYITFKNTNAVYCSFSLRVYYVNHRLKLNDSHSIERFICRSSTDHVLKKKKAAVNLISRWLELFRESPGPFEIKEHSKKESAQPLYQNGCADMAEKEGFEPSRRLSQPTPLAGEPLRPLGYFSVPDFRCQSILSHPPRVVNPFYRKISRMTAIAPSISLGVRNGERLSRTVPVSSVPPLSCAVGAQ